MEEVISQVPKFVQKSKKSQYFHAVMPKKWALSWPRLCSLSSFEENVCSFDA
jgi:hypothetical protein